MDEKYGHLIHEIYLDLGHRLVALFFWFGVAVAIKNMLPPSFFK